MKRTFLVVSFVHWEIVFQSICDVTNHALRPHLQIRFYIELRDSVHFSWQIWIQPSSVKLCTHIILHCEAGTFSCRSKKHFWHNRLIFSVLEKDPSDERHKKSNLPIIHALSDTDLILHCTLHTQNIMIYFDDHCSLVFVFKHDGRFQYLQESSNSHRLWHIEWYIQIICKQACVLKRPARGSGACDVRAATWASCRWLITN